MNLHRTAGIIATGSLALALIGAGVGAAFTDHWGATQTATIGPITPPPPPTLLTITSNSEGVVIDQIAKTVTFANFVITTPDSDPMGNAGYDQFGITSTGTGMFQVSATVTSDMPAAELAKFTLSDGTTNFVLGSAPVVVATQTGPGSMYLGLSLNWAGLAATASSYSLTLSYSIDAS